MKLKYKGMRFHIQTHFGEGEAHVRAGGQGQYQVSVRILIHYFMIGSVKLDKVGFRSG